MKLVSRFYNEEKFRRDVDDALKLIDMDEAQSWLRHPCTQALKAAIQADMCGIINVWLDGGYSNEMSIDATAQIEAKARGMSSAMDDILESIDEIGHLKIGEEND
jgi:hypothetical protein